MKIDDFIKPKKITKKRKKEENWTLPFNNGPTTNGIRGDFWCSGNEGMKKKPQLRQIKDPQREIITPIILIEKETLNLIRERLKNHKIN